MHFLFLYWLDVQYSCENLVAQAVCICYQLKIDRRRGRLIFRKRIFKKRIFKKHIVFKYKSNEIKYYASCVGNTDLYVFTERS